MKRRYTIVAEFDDDSPVYSDRQRDVISAMPPKLREQQVAAALEFGISPLKVISVTEVELVDLALVRNIRTH